MAVPPSYRFSKASFGLDDDGRRARMARLAHVIRAEWGAEARQELHTSLPAYLKAIQIKEVTENSCTVELPGEGVDGHVAQLARMMEFGLGPGGIGTEGPFDVRTFLLKGRKYVNVPFSMTLALIQSFGGKGAVNEAKRLPATTTAPDGRTLWGGRMPGGMAPKIAEHHKADPLQDMVRRESTFSRRKNGKAVRQTTDYRTWRRASWANKDPRAWLHRGIKARRIADRIVARLGDLIRETF